MVAIKTLSFLAFAIGALAGPVGTTELSKPFKIGVTFKDGQTLYLTKGPKASPSIADGVECIIETTKNAVKSIGKLSCGPDAKSFSYSEFHTTDTLQPVVSDKKNVDWRIEADGTLFWGALPIGTKSVSFSRIKGQDAKNIYAEVCSTFNHHTIFPGLEDYWYRGEAKAYFV